MCFRLAFKSRLKLINIYDKAQHTNKQTIRNRINKQQQTANANISVDWKLSIVNVVQKAIHKQAKSRSPQSSMNHSLARDLELCVRIKANQRAVDDLDERRNHLAVNAEIN